MIESLASSVIMPHPASERKGLSSPSIPVQESATVASGSPSSVHSDSSFESSVSLIDAPVSDAGDFDDAVYEDSVSQIVVALPSAQRTAPEPNTLQDIEYVMLYDSASSEDE